MDPGYESDSATVYGVADNIRGTSVWFILKPDCDIYNLSCVAKFTHGFKGVCYLAIMTAALPLFLWSSSFAVQTDPREDDFDETPLIPRILWQVEMAAAGATADRMPLWQVSNRGGRYLDRRSDGLIGARLGTDWHHAQNRHDPESGRSYNRWYTWKPDFRAAVDLIGKPESGQSRVYEAFLQLRYGPFEATGGRKRYTTGLAYDPLSTGSMGMSTNHAPFPRITAGIPHFIPIPFTFRLLEFKGQFSHGWLESDRFTSSPWLHEKFVFVQTHSAWPVRLRGGITHFAMWGGVHPEFGQTSSSFDDYLRIIFVRSADPGSEISQNIPQWGENAIGDHQGVIEFGAGWELFGMEWDAYRQFFFEDGSGMRFYYNRDGLGGLRIRPQKDRTESWAGGWIHTLLLEHLGTTWQSGPGPHDPPTGPDDPFYDPDEPYFDPDYPYNFGGRDHFYNHYIYRNGWSYRGRSMGTPLFVQQDRGKFYYPDGGLVWREFVSNRVQAWHMGVMGDLSGLKNSRFRAVSATGRVLSGYRLMITRARHQGVYENIDIFNQIIDPEAPFADKPLQYHTMLELSGRLPWFDGQFNAFNTDGDTLLNKLRFTLAFSLDAGELTNHSGVLIGIRWGNAPF